MSLFEKQDLAEAAQLAAVDNGLLRWPRQCVRTRLKPRSQTHGGGLARRGSGEFQPVLASRRDTVL